MIKIDVAGTESGELEDLLNNVHKAIHDLGLDAEIYKVTDVNEIAERFGIVVTPAIFVNGKQICSGHIIDVEDIKKCLTTIK